MLSLDQQINCTLQGRYVIYYNERRPGVKYPDFYSQYAYNELCEVEVYGCNGTFGDDCIYLCPNNCQDRRCDTITGHCLSCVPGYKGPICNQVCNNTYGPACALKCGNWSNREACHHINGTCLHGCAEGTTGDTCQEGVIFLIIIINSLDCYMNLICMSKKCCRMPIRILWAGLQSPL